MKPFLLIIFLLTLTTGRSQKVGIPSTFNNTFTKLGLDKKYDQSAFLTPAFMQSDFNGDGTQDVAILITAKATKKTASETLFDEKRGDIIGSKTIKLLRPGILIESVEDGAGGIIYWNGKKYVWIYQGE